MIFVLERGFDGERQGWEGALVIYAESEAEAVKMFKARFRDEEPFKVKEVALTPGILYEDELR